MEDHQVVGVTLTAGHLQHEAKQSAIRVGNLVTLQENAGMEEEVVEACREVVVVEIGMTTEVVVAMTETVAETVMPLTTDAEVQSMKGVADEGAHHMIAPGAQVDDHAKTKDRHKSAQPVIFVRVANP